MLAVPVAVVVLSLLPVHDDDEGSGSFAIWGTSPSVFIILDKIIPHPPRYYIIPYI